MRFKTKLNVMLRFELKLDVELVIMFGFRLGLDLEVGLGLECD